MTDRLYDLAFLFKKSKLWKKVFEENLFAVRLSSGEIGYCCITGRNGEHIALILYIGQAGANSLHALLDTDPIDSMFGRPTDLLVQDCVQCSLESKDELHPEDLAELQAYAKDHGIRFAGAHAYPQFVRYKPYGYPWRVTEEADQIAIGEALEAAITLSEMLKTYNKDMIGLNSYSPMIPLLFKDSSGAFQVETTEFPAEAPITFTHPGPASDFSILQLKKFPRKQILQCEVFRIANPVQDEEGAMPYFPAMLMAVDKESDLVIPVKAVHGREYDPDQMLTEFIDALLDGGIYPKRLEIRTDETEAILADFCQKANIILKRVKNLPQVDDAIDSMDEYLGGMNGDDDDPDFEEFESAFDELDEAVNALATLSDKELKAMPKEMFTLLFELEELLPEDLVERLHRLFGAET